ncbi:unnamed protein product [Cuscuta campestris]|uniref:Uncharacterized protein n=1 Tax=Cuscuta campestris TaxID=132261 RepID=A0A484MUW4_9ASTE|nr:unnamed protein product [Cuscuta campestris]
MSVLFADRKHHQASPSIIVTLFILPPLSRVSWSKPWAASAVLPLLSSFNFFNFQDEMVVWGRFPPPSPATRRYAYPASTLSV